jgi:hypothetical protein
LKPASVRASRSRPAEARSAIERFLAASKAPLLVEPGEDPIPIIEGHYALDWRSGYLVLEVWSEERNLSRRITALIAESDSRVELEIERFGKRAGTIALMENPASVGARRRNFRLAYRERFRRSILRQFPGWQVSQVSTEADLEHSLSPSFPRALVRRGAVGWAAIGASPESDVDGVLTFGLIWLDYLRGREPKLTIEGLALFLPEGRERTTCLRLRWMNPNSARFAVFVQFEDGFEDRAELADYGNLETHLDRCTRAVAEGSREAERWTEELAGLQDVERIGRPDGAISLRVRGLEFARLGASGLMFGLETRRKATASNLREIAGLAAGIAEFRCVSASDRANPLYARNPEGWLESQVRANLQDLDATLKPFPVYGQVPAFTAGDRDVIDLLAVDSGGRLAVIELKAAEDIHLPLQALDYWMRVRWHAGRGEFGPNGYFPGIELRREAPRLLLVAPSLDFHPANERVLRYFDRSIAVERIGIGSEWRNRVKVMYRHRSGD